MALTFAYYTLFAFAICLASVVVYRRLLHPLARVPGPFLPSITRLYLWYWNIIKPGLYYKKIEEMHAEYGPIIRIAPNEVHLADPSNYDKIYSISGKFDKDPLFYGTLNMEVMFTSISNEEHRRRSAPLTHFFSRRAVLELEDIVQAKAEKLCDRVRKALEADRSIDLHAGMRAVGIDIVTEYAFDNCWNHLEEPDFGIWFSDTVRGLGATWWIFQQFPFLMKPVLGIPEKYARKMSPSLKGWLDITSTTRNHVMRVRRNIEAGIKPKRRTIFHELLDPSNLEKGGSNRRSADDLAAESLGICGAASDTTGNAMEMAAYHVVNNPDIYKALRKELCEAFPNPTDRMKFTTLEKLPYLGGVVKEGMRLSYGVISRLARAVPKDGATFNGYFIPAGTTVGMSSWMMHRNPDAFPNPEIFDPDRWTDPKEARFREKHLVPFSRGSRTCIGQNLAQCELYVTLGMLFRRFDNLAAWDVGPEDMTYEDWFTAFHPKDARPFQIIGKR